MDAFEKKYGIKEDAKVKSFHSNRRMFAVVDGKLHVAPEGVDYSHATWFEKEGWITVNEDGRMDTVTRGFVDGKGDIYFYVGYDFVVTQECEKEFFTHLAELKKQLDLSDDNAVYGGLVRQTGEGQWPGKKSYGAVGSLL